MKGRKDRRTAASNAVMKSPAFALLVLVACGGGASQAPAPDPIAPPPAAPAPASAPAPIATPARPAPAPPAPPAPAPVTADALRTAELAAFERAKPVFDKWCARCHAEGGRATSAKKRSHFDMTRYPFGGHHAADIADEVREVLGLTGEKPTMPPNKKGAVRGDELALIQAWADAFDAAHATGAAHDHHGGHAH